MKTFKDFLKEAENTPSFADVYASKVDSMRKNQLANIQRRRKNTVHPAIQKMQDEKDQEEYVNNIKKETRKEVKKEYGIEDDKD
jgi:hypothetical protein